MMEEEYRQKIIHYYNRCQIDYEWAWHLKKRMAMHYGYWDESTERLRYALTNMNREVAAFVQVKEGDYVLDAGCGVGGSSIYLAQNLCCQTMGITLGEKQVQVCRDNASRHNVADLCSFEVQSYLSTNFADNTFDVVWAIESLCYAPEKTVFLHEALRILKPGGRLVVADFFRNGVPEGGRGDLLMQKMERSWAIRKFAEKEDFWSDLNETGFEECRRKDVSMNVKNSVRKLYRRFFLGLPTTLVLQAVGYRNLTQFSNVMSAYYQYHAFRRGLWKYIFFSGRKPLPQPGKKAG